MTCRFLVPLLACLLLAGCEIPAQTFWAPDGSRAAYLPTSGPDTTLSIIDDTGNVLANLGPTAGGFAWSNDSKRLYFATLGCAPKADGGFETQYTWLNADETDDNPPDNDPDQKRGLTLNLWQDNKTTPLFWLERPTAWYLTLSPDQNWLALLTTNPETKDEAGFRLYAFSIPAKRLYPLSVGCGKGACFTAPNRLAFFESTNVRKGQPSDLGQLVEITLLDKPDKPERKSLAGVLIPAVSWVQPAGDDILFTCIPMTLPITLPLDGPEPVHSLFRYSRADGSLKPVVPGVAEYFMPSPDGKLLLIVKLDKPAAANAQRADLAVVELATAAVHLLRDANTTVKEPPNAQYTGMPAFPAWRTSSEITFTAPVDPQKAPVEKDNRLHFDLVLYRLTPDFKLEPLRTLSEKWPTEMKPALAKGPHPQPIPDPGF